MEGAADEETQREVDQLLHNLCLDLEVKVEKYKADLRAVKRLNPDLTSQVDKSIKHIDRALEDIVEILEQSR